MRKANKVIAGLAGLLIAVPVFASDVQAKTQINYQAIEQIESAGNPKAYNKNSRAIGLRQITPIVLKDWNECHPNETYVSSDLFNQVVNRKIGNWYIDIRIPKYLRQFHLKDSIENRLASYNWGIGNVRRIKDARENFERLPKETQNYISKYSQFAGDKK